MTSARTSKQMLSATKGNTEPVMSLGPGAGAQNTMACPGNWKHGPKPAQPLFNLEPHPDRSTPGDKFLAFRPRKNKRRRWTLCACAWAAFGTWPSGCRRTRSGALGLRTVFELGMNHLVCFPTRWVWVKIENPVDHRF